jgi:O-antigen ligase
MIKRFLDQPFGLHRLLFGCAVLASIVLVTVGTVLSLWSILALAVALPFILFWPVETALGVFCLLVPFDTVLTVSDAAAGPSGQGGGTTVNYLVGAGAALVVVATGLVRGTIRRPPAAAVWWGLFIAWSATSALWAFNPDAVRDRLPTALTSYLFYLAVISVRITKKEWLAVAGFTVVGGCGAALLAIYQFSTGVYYMGNIQRSTISMDGKDTNPNTFAARLLLPIALTIAGYLATKGRMKWFCAAACALMGFALLLSMSRGNTLALMAMILIFLLRYKVRWQVLALLALLGCTLILLPREFFSRVEDSVSSRAEKRFDIWIVGTEMIKEHGIVGVGLNNFPVVFEKFSGAAVDFVGFNRDPHSNYLSVGAELGIVGLLLFLGAIASQLRAARRQIRSKLKADDSLSIVIALEAACWGLLVGGLSATSLWRKEFWVSWMLLALAVRLHQDAVRAHDRVQRASPVITWNTPHLRPAFGQRALSR